MCVFVFTAFSDLLPFLFRVHEVLLHKASGSPVRLILLQDTPGRDSVLSPVENNGLVQFYPRFRRILACLPIGIKWVCSNHE